MEDGDREDLPFKSLDSLFGQKRGPVEGGAATMVTHPRVCTSEIRNSSQWPARRLLIFGGQGPFHPPWLPHAVWRLLQEQAQLPAMEWGAGAGTVLGAEIDQNLLSFTIQAFPGSCNPSVGSRLSNTSNRFCQWNCRLVKVKVAQSCPTLCDPLDYTVHGILQARILEWVAVPFSRRSSQPRDRTQVSRMAGRFFTNWITREAQEYWSGWPIPSPGIFPTRESNQDLLHHRRILTSWATRGALCCLEGRLISILFPPSGDLIMYFPH